jgi:hypothetical protein
MKLPGVFPDYVGHGLLNLVASCASACGARPAHPTLSGTHLEHLSQARNVVLLIVDGLGYNYLAARAGSRLHSGLAARLTSVFPSTTASAITTTFTARAPAEHGLTGWYTWFPEVDAVVAPLPFKLRGTQDTPEMRGIQPAALYAGDPMFDALGVSNFVVSPTDIIDSGYNRHYCGRATRIGYMGMAGLVSQTEAAVKSSGARKFIYSYTPEFDACAHRFGVDSPQTASVFGAIDEAVSSLLARLSGTDTALVVTADHGFIDCPPDHALDLDECPDLRNLLRLPLTGERRAAFCHVLPGRQEEFAARARDWLDGRADIVSGTSLVDAGYFGPGPRHPQLHERAGDVALLMRGSWTVKDWLPGEHRTLHIGNHGGLSPDEMYIPLVLASA